MRFEDEPIIKPKKTVETIDVVSLSAKMEQEMEDDKRRRKEQQDRLNAYRLRKEKGKQVEPESIPVVISENQEGQPVHSSPVQIPGVKIMGKIELPERGGVVKKEVTPKTIQENLGLSEEQIDDLFSQALRILGGNQINENELIEKFVHIHGIEKIEKDLKEIRAIETNIRQEETAESIGTKKLATILEAVLAYAISATTMPWFGKGVKLEMPNRIDEVKKGVDAILEFTTEGIKKEFLALGIDVTFANLRSESFSNKINNILNGIDLHKITELDYFMDDNDIPFVETHNLGDTHSVAMPKVIFAIQRKDVEEVAMLWAKRRGSPTAKEALFHHRLRCVLIRQIIAQCQIFAAYADEKNFTAIADQYRNIMTLTQRIETDEFQKNDIDNAVRDTVFFKDRLALITEKHIPIGKGLKEKIMLG